MGEKSGTLTKYEELYNVNFISACEYLFVMQEVLYNNTIPCMFEIVRVSELIISNFEQGNNV
jgi:hypothetical protein